jgi:hypothetical protein
LIGRVPTPVAETIDAPRRVLLEMESLEFFE